MRINDRFVFFYSKNDIYSQHFPAGFTYSGVYFQSSEHFMMLAKFLICDKKFMTIADYKKSIDKKRHHFLKGNDLREHCRFLSSVYKKEIREVGFFKAYWDLNEHNKDLISRTLNPVLYDFELGEKIIYAKTPQVAKNLGRSVVNYSDTLWHPNRESVIDSASLLKFSQNNILREQFKIDGKGRNFVEASVRDKIYGVGLDENSPLIDEPNNWKGLNLLGHSLDRTYRKIFEG